MICSLPPVEEQQNPQRWIPTDPRDGPGSFKSTPDKLSWGEGEPERRETAPVSRVPNALSAQKRAAIPLIQQENEHDHWYIPNALCPD